MTTSAIGAILILVGIVLFVVDLHVIGHGLLTAGGIVLLLAGGFALLWAGVAYSGVLFGVLVVVTVRSPVGVQSEGWVFVHGERWRALLAFVPEEADPQDREPVVGTGRKVRVVGFDEGGELQVVPTRPAGSGRDLDRPG